MESKAYDRCATIIAGRVSYGTKRKHAERHPSQKSVQAAGFITNTLVSQLHMFCEHHTGLEATRQSLNSSGNQWTLPRLSAMTMI